MNITDVVATLIGQKAWLPRLGVGSFVTIEFGTPHLLTREPIIRDGVHPRLARRRVTVQGDLHLWLQADDWLLQSERAKISSRDQPLAITQGLDILAGQKLIDVKITKSTTEFCFEYGETLIVHAAHDTDQTQWTLFWHNAGNASWLSRNELRIEGKIGNFQPLP